MLSVPPRSSTGPRLTYSDGVDGCTGSAADTSGDGDPATFSGYPRAVEATGQVGHEIIGALDVRVTWVWDYIAEPSEDNDGEEEATRE